MKKTKLTATQRTIIYSCLFGSLAIFAQTTDWFGIVVMFLFFGIIPGVQEPLNATVMLAIYLTAACFITAAVTRDYLVSFSRTLTSSPDAS